MICQDKKFFRQENLEYLFESPLKVLELQLNVLSKKQVVVNS